MYATELENQFPISNFRHKARDPFLILFRNRAPDDRKQKFAFGAIIAQAAPREVQFP